MKSLYDYIEHLAEEIDVPAGTILFKEGDSVQYAYKLISGTCMLSKQAIPIGAVPKHSTIAPTEAIGGIEYTQRAICQSDCKLVQWDMTEAWKIPEFSLAARQSMMQQIRNHQNRLEELSGSIYFKGNSAQLNAGAFEFPNSEIIFAFCHAELSSLQLPDGVSRMGNSLLIAFANFPNSRYANAPDKTFSYSETTFFVPVRVGATLGLYVPYIYPSSYEAILLGREIYGFPKRLGYTEWAGDFENGWLNLYVDDERLIALDWDWGAISASEAQLVGAMGSLFGVQGQLTSAAFRVGDTLLNLMNVPFYRRISVYNHKLIPDIATKYDEPKFAVDQLTQAIFQVERWHSIEKLNSAHISQVGRMLQNWHIQVREVYMTRLDMRLSTGRLIRDYKMLRKTHEL
jgi:hypothetical protein